jgi:hypothetical protein
MLEAAARVKAPPMSSSAFGLEHGALAPYGTDFRVSVEF